MIATGNDNQFSKLCTILGEPKLAEQPEYLVNSDRLKNREKLVMHISNLTMRWQRADLLAKLEAVQVPAGPINALDQVFADPQVIARGMQLSLPCSAATPGKIPGVRPPIILGDRYMAAERPSRQLGEHAAQL